jgi:CIC family chloride channel protein
MENTIMTEKIARRGVFTPDSYEADLLAKLTVAQVISNEGLVLSSENTIKEVRDWLKVNDGQANYFVMVNSESVYIGIVGRADIFRHGLDPSSHLNDIVKNSEVYVQSTDTLRKAVEMMAKQNVEVLPVIADGNKVISVLSYRDILACYKEQLEENDQAHIHISLKRQRLKMLISGRRLINMD